MRRALAILATALVIGWTPGCARHAGPARSSAPAGSIGVAWLEADGTLVLQLRAQGAGGARGDGLLRFKPDDPAYGPTLQHIGPLRRGETRPVPPWSESSSGAGR